MPTRRRFAASPFVIRCLPGQTAFQTASKIKALPMHVILH
jgi:hypothetical protein